VGHPARISILAVDFGASGKRAPGDIWNVLGRAVMVGVVSSISVTIDAGGKETSSDAQIMS
jgi:hypothetical protein